MRAVGAAKTKHSEQTDRAENQQTVDDATVFQLLVVELHCQQHHDEPNCDPNALLDHVVKLIAILLLRDEC